MIQARVIKPHDIEFFEVPAPEAKDLKDNEILLRIHKIGVCGSDIHVMHGQHPFVTYPVIILFVLFWFCICLFCHSTVF